MKKLLEVSIGNWSETAFALDNRRMQGEELVEFLNKECNPYKTQDREGVIVYLSKQGNFSYA